LVKKKTADFLVSAVISMGYPHPDLEGGDPARLLTFPRAPSSGSSPVIADFVRIALAAGHALYRVAQL
jgi:hypothetical protein